MSIDSLLIKRSKAELALNAETDQRVRKMLEEHFGAVPHKGFLDNMYELAIDTKVGKLLVSLNGHWVAMRFLDIEAAKKVLPHGYGEVLNGYTGKYNSPFFEHQQGIQFRCDVVQGMIERVTM